MTILGACLAMALRDGVMTLLVIAESRGRALLAGSLDAVGDLAQIVVTFVGVKALDSFGVHSVPILAALMLTSMVTTSTFTRIGDRVRGEDPKVAALEATVAEQGGRLAEQDARMLTLERTVAELQAAA